MRSSHPPLINLKNFPLAALLERLTPLGFPEQQVRQIMARAIYRNNPDMSGLKNLSRARCRLLEAHTVTPRLEKVEEVCSPVDRFTKFLFRTLDGHLIEAVRIPLLADRYSICVSSQVGCALGCAFCATGRLGFTRNLEPWEMVDQVLQAREGADRPVTGVLFMGQGEPFLNYEQVIQAATILREPTGAQIRADNITISTSGIVPGIRRFTREGHPFRLIVSLSAATSEKRLQVMPVEARYPLADLLSAIAEYSDARKTRATIAWVAIEGFNTGDEEIAALETIVRDVPVRFNLIEVNDPSGVFRPPRGEDFRTFARRLQRLKVPIAHRYAGGQDIHAACGMLASARISAYT